ncbi:winged helix-turn-helix domain-containing protein [uncultured Paludibaculum sp.]|uniref:winged helix-turn-helix domain-containing protein n=1 Tax=uncultured Paludibaculum sp. TaxID=1765020 RepID=UPI002AABFA4E|nr:winged helix-turn-helix domain-containing protein [uncultured Paludibaculum sp.]
MFVESLSYQFDDVVIEPHNHRLLRAGRVLEVEPKAFRVLVYLAENRDRVVSKDELVRAVWGGTFVSDNALTRVIAQLRKQLGDTARDSRVIETVPTVGYRFLPELAPVTSRPVEAAAPRNLRWLFWLAVIPLIGWFWWLRRAEVVPAPPQLVQLTTSSGVDMYPSFSPDGGSVAFSSDRSGRFEIYVRPLAKGSRAMRITNDGMQNLQPAWSPDGRYLAFTSQFRGGIAVVPSLGGVVRMVTEFGSQPAWSPDGQTIAFRSEGIYSLSPLDVQPSGPATIWVVGVNGGTPRQLTRPYEPKGGHSNPIWTPEGRILFMANTRVFQSQLWSMDPDGRSKREVKLPVPLMGSVSYSAGSRTLHFVSLGDKGALNLYRVGLEDDRTVAEAQRLAPMMAAAIPRDLAASRDGKTLAVTLSNMTTALCEIPEAGGEEKVLLRDNSFRNSFPAFSPDGRKIAFYSRRFGDPGDFWVMDADGRNPTQVTTLPQGERLPTWSRDGRELSTICHDGGRLQVCFTSLDGVLRKVPVDVRPNSWARISPDGGKIAMQRMAGDGRASIWVDDVPGGHARSITPDNVSIGFPLWAPDGRWVVGEIRTGTDTNLALLPLEGGAPVVLTEGRGHAWPGSWAADGDRIAYAGLRGGVWNLFWVSRSTRKTQQLTHNESLAVYLRYPAWSPVSDRIVFERGEVRSNVFLLEEP